MQKTPCVILAAISFLATASCGEPGQRQDLLFLRTPRGIAVVKSGASSATIQARRALPSRDWSIVYRTAPAGRSTDLTAVDPASGNELWTGRVPGALEVTLVSESGDMVVLEPRGQQTGYGGRSRRTTLVVSGSGVRQAQTVTLRGNYQPEAFSTDGRSLFVLQYLPARAPTSYRVRRLDLASERVRGVYTADGDLQESMRGTARIQALSPDGRRLYTLYSLRAQGERYAFVHVLSLDELWAHCIDLPQEFGAAMEWTTALTVAPDGKRLYVANSEIDSLVEIDADALKVVRATDVEFGGPGRAAHAVYSGEGGLYLGSGRRIVAVDAESLTVSRTFDADAGVRGIQAASDGRRLYVGLKDRIAVLDVIAGEWLRDLQASGVSRISELGRSTRLLEEDREEITCAC